MSAVRRWGPLAAAMLLAGLLTLLITPRQKLAEKLGPLTLGQKQGEVFLGRDFSSHPDYSDQVAFEIDTEIRRMIDEAHDEALDILTENRVHLDRIAGVLVERETIDKEELIDLLDGLVKRPKRGSGAGIAVARRSMRHAGGRGPSVE